MLTDASADEENAARNLWSSPRALVGPSEAATRGGVGWRCAGTGAHLILGAGGWR